MNNVMIDLETLSKEPNAALVAIGAVFFEPSTGQLSESFYLTVDPANSQRNGGHVCAETVAWWCRQSAEVRAELTTESVSEWIALRDFMDFLGVHGPRNPDNLRVWCKGASFDFPIIKSALERNHYPTPWNYWNERCLRPLIACAGVTGYVPHPRKTESHNALTDAVYQAEMACEIWQRLTAHNIDAGIA